MAALNELIDKIENPELRAQIQEAANKLAKQKKFGLVFEEHLPECTPLYDIPVKKGATVSVKSGSVNNTFKVIKIENGKAWCMPKSGNNAIEYPFEDLVVTAEFGEAIYPYLSNRWIAFVMLQIAICGIRLLKRIITMPSNFLNIFMRARLIAFI